VTRRRNIERALDGSALGLVVFVLLRWIHFGWRPPVTVANQLLPLVLGAALPLALAAAVLRRRRAALVLGLGGLAFFVVIGPRLWPGAAPAIETPPGTHLRVLTFNLADDLTDPAEVVAYLAASGADVIALQELAQPVADALEVALLEEYPYRIFHGLGIPGSGVLSRTPILSQELLHLTPARPYPMTVIEFAGRELTLIGVHAQAWVGAFSSWVSDVRNFPTLAELAVANGPTLLVGDFNTTEFSHAYRAFPGAGLIDAYRAANRDLGFTFPINGRYRGLPGSPFVRIDHIWHTRDFTTVRCWVGADGGSDHYPLFADLVLEDVGPD